MNVQDGAQVNETNVRLSDEEQQRVDKLGQHDRDAYYRLRANGSTHHAALSALFGSWY